MGPKILFVSDEFGTSHLKIVKKFGEVFSKDLFENSSEVDCIVCYGDGLGKVWPTIISSATPSIVFCPIIHSLDMPEIRSFFKEDKKPANQNVQVVIYANGKNPEEQFDFANTVIKDKSNIFIVHENVTMSMEFRLRNFFDKFFGIKEQTILARWIYRWLVAHDLMDINAKILIENSSVFLRIKLDAIESADLIIEFERTFYDYNICLQSHKDKPSIIQERDYVYLNDACK